MEFKVRIPFVELLGMELQRFDPGESEIHLELRDELTNSWSVAHGGVTMTLLDVAMAHAARSPLASGGEPQPGVVTIEMKTSFMRPGQGRLVATGRRLHMHGLARLLRGLGARYAGPARRPRDRNVQVHEGPADRRRAPHPAPQRNGLTP